MKTVRKIKKYVTWKTVLISAILYVFMFCVNNGSFVNLMKNTGVQILDIKFGYLPHEAYQTMANLGKQGREAYFSCLIMDCIFPVIYTLFLMNMIAYLLNKAKHEKTDIFLTFPLAAMLFDWIENIAIIGMIFIFPNEVVWLELLGCVATLIKSFFSGVSFIVIIILLVRIMKDKIFYNKK